MMRVVSICAIIWVAFVPVSQLCAQNKPGDPHPLAPSLKILTKEENARIDRIINQFILYDAGQLKGANGKKILAEFNALGPEATLNLIAGFNRAAKLKASCPAVVIARKLRVLFRRTRDTTLLEFARESLGSGKIAQRHMGVVRDMRLLLVRRRGYLQRAGLAIDYANIKPPKKMSVDELVSEVTKASGERFRNVLIELETRDDSKARYILARAVASKVKSVQQLGEKLLSKHMNRQNAEVVKTSLKDKRPEVRAAATRTIAERKLSLMRELVTLISDEEESVRQAARTALKRFSNGEDFGPRIGASDAQRTAARRDWEAWRQSQGLR